MAELVDALALGASGRKAVQVQVLLHAQRLAGKRKLLPSPKVVWQSGNAAVCYTVHVVIRA